MSFDTIAISQFQKAPAKAFSSTIGREYVLSNNKVLGAIITKSLIDYLEETGILDDYEDYLLTQDFSDDAKEAHEEFLEMKKNKDYSSCVSLENL
jgi:hypothetical protein